jgi:hypothetical protein
MTMPLKAPEPLKPSVYRFYLAMMGLGMATGITHRRCRETQ